MRMLVQLKAIPDDPCPVMYIRIFTPAQAEKANRWLERMGYVGMQCYPLRYLRRRVDNHKM
jgi:hypothetical protein